MTKLDDGTEKSAQSSEGWCGVSLGLVPSATELRARRLQWYQNLMKDLGPHQNVLLALFGEVPFESDTIYDESGTIREAACWGARQWQEDVDGLGVFDDCASFLERGGGAVDHWFLDNGLLGIRAADRAVNIPPPSFGLASSR